MKKLIALTILLLSNIAQAELKSQVIQYEENDTIMHGYHVYDDQYEGKRPGILLVHEWWGQSDYVRNKAKLLAKQGYSVMAVDMYGSGKTAENVAQAGSMSAQIMNNMQLATARFISAKRALIAHKMTNSNKIAAIGYSFGGSLVLKMARAGINLDAAVNFYGQLTGTKTAKEGDIKAKLLVFEGESDPFMSKEQIASFEKEMKQANVDYQILTYPNAQHGFTNPNSNDNGRIHNLPLAYNEHADEHSWKTLNQFLSAVFE